MIERRLSDKDNALFAVEIALEEGESGYDAVGTYIRRYWENNTYETVIVSLELSSYTDGSIYYPANEIASPINFDDIEYLYDWWEGERLIRIKGIRSVSSLEISEGLYTCDKESV